MSRRGRNVWRDRVVDAWRSADHAWWLAMEAATSLYATEMEEYKRLHPRPKLRDFMTHLSHGTPTESEVAA